MRKAEQTTAIMQKVIVFNNQVRIGYGYVFHYDNGKMNGPDLYRDNGEKLPEGYYNLLMTDEINLIVIPRNKQ